MPVKTYSIEQLIKKANDPKNSHNRKYYRDRLKYRFNIDYKTGKEFKPIEVLITPKLENPITEETPYKTDVVIDKEYTDITEIITFEKPCRIGIFGLQGSGKTTLSKEIAYLHFDKTMLFDIVGEYKEFHRYKTESRSYPEVAMEFDAFYKWFNKTVLSKNKPNILIIDEASRVAPNRRPLPDGLAELNDLHRHFNNSFIVVARRPVQIHTDLLELLNYIICFKLSGTNDLERLKDINTDLEASVKTLKVYEYVVYDVAQGKIFYGQTQG